MNSEIAVVVESSVNSGIAVARAALSGQTGVMGWEPLGKPSGPRRLEEALDQVASGLKAPRVQVLKMVFEAWEDFVGSVMAAHSSPARLVDGELVVSVDDPAWATEMKFFSGELIDRINTAAEEEAVTSLTVRVRPR